jgi:phage gpG-like protein
MPGFGMTATFDDVQLSDAVHRLAEFPGERQNALFAAIGNAGVTKTVLRFQTQTGPDGQPWLPSKRVLKEGGKTLQLHGYLVGSIVYNLLANGVEWGSGLVYALIHQLGGTITSYARGQTVGRKLDKDGITGKFVKRRHADLIQFLTLPEYRITIPARPYVGMDGDDAKEFASLGVLHLQAALLGTTVSSLRVAA